MPPESTIFALLICCAVESCVLVCLERTNDNLRKIISALERDNERLEAEASKLAAKLTVTKRILNKRKGEMSG